MHRIQWFDQQIRAGSYPNSNHLAEHFEISKRQAQRDIEYLAASLRAPVQYIAKQRGYCYEDDSFILPLLYITEEENRVLKYLAYRYSHYNYENADTIRRIGSLLDRFTDNQELNIEAYLPVFEVDTRRIQYIELLDHAIRAHLIVRIIYQEQAGVQQEMHICPAKLTRHYDDDHVIAHIEGQGRLQTFRLSDILRLNLTERQFEADIEDERRQQGRTQQIKPFKAQIRLAVPPQDSIWYGYKVCSSTEDIYEVEFYDSDGFLGHLLTSEWRQIIAPKWLREKIRSRCRGMLELLNEQGDSNDT
ncbi:helix-turn-helix transcriptional regulator [Paenibacillus sp. IHBB 10380]|uniref:helix-turn-helix transcriptional regulator n=1 Tax=Paenibacillus sp. IHBB 10380 TaxID=1566358 RepID=UPI001F47BBD0|nr:WYL domain-containing protein [Paenibacillus sp. IHBB 10380]